MNPETVLSAVATLVCAAAQKSARELGCDTDVRTLADVLALGRAVRTNQADAHKIDRRIIMAAYTVAWRASSALENDNAEDLAESFRAFVILETLRAEKTRDLQARLGRAHEIEAAAGHFGD